MKQSSDQGAHIWPHQMCDANYKIGVLPPFSSCQQIHIRMFTLSSVMLFQPILLIKGYFTLLHSYCTSCLSPIFISCPFDHVLKEQRCTFYGGAQVCLGSGPESLWSSAHKTSKFLHHKPALLCSYGGQYHPTNTTATLMTFLTFVFQNVLIVCQWKTV